MANDNNYYIAWDGKHYFGSPPHGWFLAADNRWWPSTDLINGPAADEQVDRYQTPAADVVSPSGQIAPPPPPRHTEAEAQRADWAPVGQPTGETSAPRGRRTARNRRRRTSGRPIGLLIFAAFALTRCLSFDGQPDDNPPVVVTVEASVPTEGEAELGGELVVANTAQYRASTESCVGGMIVGSISNFSGVTMTFVIESAVPDGVSRQSAPVTIDSFGQAVWQIEAPVFGQVPCELSEVYTLE